jgi:rhodanese-related sulfurtransferase
LAAIGIAASHRRHGSIWPTAIAVSGVALILWAMYGSYSPATELGGFLLLIVATLLDLRTRRKPSIAAEGVSWIEPSDLIDRLGRDGGSIVVDVRTPDEFTGPLGHILGAHNVPVGELASRIRELVALKDKGVVLVCRSDRRSSAASSVLREAGFQNVQVLHGGMERWNQEGRAING